MTNTHVPKLRLWQPSAPSPEQQAAWAQMRREAAERRERETAARRGLLVALGTTAADLDAAASCHCRCHPRPGDPDADHEQSSCHCQWTAQERRERRERALNELLQWGTDDDDGSEDRRTAEFEERAARMGVMDPAVRCGGAPVVVSGIVDGRAFYFRERHDEYRVTIAVADDPLTDPWQAPAEVPSIDIAGGWGTFSYADALEVAVDAVRTYLGRVTCHHDQPEAGHPYCSRCGIRLAERELWHEPEVPLR